MPYSSALYTNWSRIHLFLHISIRLPFSVVISLVGVISYAFSFLSLTSSNANRRWWQCENIPLLCLSHHTLFSAYFTCISLVSSFQSLLQLSPDTQRPCWNWVTFSSRCPTMINSYRYKSVSATANLSQARGNSSLHHQVPLYAACWELAHRCVIISVCVIMARGNSCVVFSTLLMMTEAQTWESYPMGCLYTGMG